MNTLIIDNYDSYTQILANQIWNLTGSAPLVLKNDSLSVEEIKELTFDHIVISPGPGRPEKLADFGICSELIKAYPHIPILGVCLGHQGLGLFTGAKITYAPAVYHGVQSPVKHSGHALFKGVPSPFIAMRYHSLVIDKTSLNENIEVIATSEDDAQVMAIKVKDRPFYGVQFHPESVGTMYGSTILKNFLNISHDFKLEYNIKVKKHSTHKFSMQPLTWKPPENVFEAFYRKSEHAFWLDSCGLDDWSFMGTGVELSEFLTQNPMLSKRGKLDNSSQGSLTSIQNLLRAYELDSAGHDCPFQGGFVGFLGFEALEENPLYPEKGLPEPSSTFLFVDQFLAFHHSSQTLYYCRVFEKGVLNSSEAFEDFKKQLDGILNIEKERDSAVTSETKNLEPVLNIQTHQSQEEYLRSIKKIKHLIHEGETYEVCLSNNFTLPVNVDGWELYLDLRKVNAAPYAGYFHMPDCNILCSSPEGFLKVDKNKTVITRPIKGTRKKGDTPEETLALRNDLITNPKDNSELLMITDLLRNDLSHVCKPGSIQVNDLKKVTEYSTLMQLSSTVSGQLRDECDNVDLLKACFPGGSVSGAPKKRTLEIIRSLENRQRGVYTGSLGYFSLDGKCDFNILIRTIVHSKDQLSFGAGGAIVDQSKAEEEYAEVLLKAQPMMKAIQNSLQKSNSNKTL